MRRFLFNLVAGFLLCLGAVQAQQSLPPSKYYDWGMNALTSGRPRSYDKDAVNDFKVSAQGGYAPGQIMMGYIYETGIVVTKDPAEALGWYKKSAEQDNQLGEWLAGRLYYTGSGTPRNLTEAGNWFQKSATHDDPFGEYLMGMVDLDRKDYAGAAALFRKAAMQGLPQAELQLGLLLKNGQGVAADKSEAYSWLLTSSDAGNKSAESELPALEAQLGPQLEQAKAKAHELERTTSQALADRGCTGWPGEFDAVPTPPPPTTQMACQ
jgi:TPR repeat protein